MSIVLLFIYFYLLFILILLFLFLLLKKTEYSRNVHLIDYNFKSELNYNYVYRKIVLIISLFARFGRNFQILLANCWALFINLFKNYIFCIF